MMGVVSDAIDSLQEWCENLFKDGIKSQFDSISDLLTETFHKTTEDGGLISTFLTGHPASFSGSASGPAISCFMPWDFAPGLSLP